MTAESTQTKAFKRNFRELMKDVATSIPGHIVAFDPVTQHAQIQIGVQGVKLNGTTYTRSTLIEVPVFFEGGKNFHIEIQVDKGDEGVIHFSQRCVDGWKTTGGVADNPILRFHDIADAFFERGARSQPNVITDFTNDGVKIRNKAGDHYWHLANDGTITETNGAYTRIVNPDGSTSETNGNYTKTAAVDGTVNINGFIINADGSASSPVSLTAPSAVINGAEVASHDHTTGTYIDAEDRPLKSGNSGPLI